MEYLLTQTTKSCFTLASKNLSTSCSLNGWRQSGKAMKKVLGAPRRKKLYFEDSPKMATPQLLSKGSLEGAKSSNSRRVNVLNKLFMRYITDQLATGNCASEILGHGVEINRIRITPDYKILRVYWLAKGTVSDDCIENILQGNAGLLRHELSQLRLMGVVPKIQFVKDKYYANTAELDKRLAIADFGEDHSPLDLTNRLKTEFEILSPLNENIKDRLKQLDALLIEDNEDLPLPPMAQNVLGLNHADILERIRKSKQKSEARHRIGNNENKSAEETWVSFKLNQSMNEEPLKFDNNNAQRMAFKEFLRRRQILKSKARGEYKNFNPDLEYIKEELYERNMENLDKFNVPDDFDEDFIEEEVEDIE